MSRTITTTARLALTALRQELEGSFLEREAEITALLVALVAEEHLLLLGPPGTAKSALAQAAATALDGAYFQRLFTPFSVPEEVFGPFSVAGLQNDLYERKVDGYLPTADLAFLDEVFKANSAILNSLLTILNERAYDQGSSRMTCPLKMAIGASNELPQDEILAALYDRFIMRRWVEPTKSRDSRRALLRMKGAPSVSTRISATDLATARAEARALPLTEAAEDAILDLRDALAKTCAIEMSDRRMRKAVKVLRAFAWLQGDAEVQPRHLEILADSLWNEPSERAPILGQILTIANPAKAEAQRVLDAAVEAFQALDLSQISLAQLQTLANVKTSLKEMERTVRGMSENTDIQAIADEIGTMSAEVARAAAKALA